MMRPMRAAIVVAFMATACGGGANDLADEPTTTMAATTVTAAALPTLASIPSGVLVSWRPGWPIQPALSG